MPRSAALLNMSRRALQNVRVWRALSILLIAVGAVGLAGAASVIPSGGQTVGGEDEVVFLLHGICKTKLDMVPVERALKRKGYKVVNWSYKSRRYAMEELAAQLADVVSSHPAARISFVTHSMGGIIVRAYLQTYKPRNVHRFVMIAPPNQGALLADTLAPSLIYRFVFGPAGQQLQRGYAGACTSAGVPDCEFGIIAGGRSNSVGMNPLIPGDDDGTISVESTRLPGASDFVILPYAHPYIHMMPRTAKLCVGFLQNGRFPRPADQASVR
jgi:pimeloyl-ACP methyl ester carboxylesterase